MQITHTRTRRAALYVRISQDTEGTGLGVARQEADCRALVERKGWTLAGLYCDNDVSAYSGKVRPAYRRLLADLDAGAVDAAVVWHPDRLHRSPMELETFIEVIERTGAAVATVTAGDYDLDTPEGRLTARITCGVARKESEDKSRRLIRKHLQLAEDGMVPGGGLRPFGYEDDRVTVREEEAEMIRTATAAVLGGASLRSVVASWNASGTPTTTGRRWTTTTVKRLLTASRIAGLRSHHGQVSATAVWPAIITPDQSKRLQAVLAKPPSTRAARSYLLSGFLRCGRCGVAMTTRPTSKGVKRYVCAVDRGGCGRCGISAEGLEALISEAVRIRLASPEMAAAMASREGDDGAVLEAIEADEARLVEFAEMLADGLMSRAEWAAMRDRVEDRLEAARASLVQDAERTALHDAGGAWTATTDLETRRTILAALVESITIAPTDRAGNRFDPSRVDVTWKV